MKRLAIVAAALVFAFGAVAYSPQAEARRRGFGFGGGIIAAAVIGGVLAAALTRRHRVRYAYAPRRYYAPAYYRPAYAYRPVRFYGAGFYAPRRVHRVRRW